MNLLTSKVNGHYLITIVLVCFFCSLILVPIVRLIAIHVGAIDIPNKRSDHTLHHRTIPRLGGLAILLSFMLGYMLYARESLIMLSILMGSFLIVLGGIIDDINPLKARYKLLIQVVSALCVVIYGNLTIDELSFFGIVWKFNEPFNYIITIIFIIAITNSINLIDGIDGLATGVSSIYFITIAIIAYILNLMSGLDVILSLIMFGATLGFLVYNFPPASIFLGDTGSLFLGFIISVVALLGFKATTLTSFVVPILILAIPIIDTSLAILRRLIKGENIGAPDKEHLHHQLLKLKFSQKTSVLIIYFINILFALVSIFYILGDSKIAIFIYIILMLLFLYLVMRTDILFVHKKDKKHEKNN